MGSQKYGVSELPKASGTQVSMLTGSHHPKTFRKGLKGFPGGSVIKNPPASTREMVMISNPGRFHMPRDN